MGRIIKPYGINPKAGITPEFAFAFPSGFVIIIDTREQAPLFTDLAQKGLTVKEALPVGDYSIKGFEAQISIERKNLMDFFNSIGKQRERFKKELEILSKFLRKWIVIEASEDELLMFNTFSKIHPNSVRQTIASIEVRYNIPFHYEPDRKKLERWILDRFIKFYNLMRKENGLHV